jgi:hypothetical protein
MAAEATGSGARLDDVMLAMDVVDTLRHRENWVSRELDEIGREAELMARLRTIYASQGIAVSDAVLAQGIAALNEDRFVYTPPRPGLATTLARLWVERGRYAKAAAPLLVLLALLLGVYYQTSIRPLNEASAALSSAHSQAVELASGDAGRQRADRLLAQGEAAIEEGDTDAASQAAADLEALRAELEREYTLRIVSATWKVPPTALHERIFYLIVEAVAPDGGILPLPVAGDGGTKQVSRWGIEVNRDVFVPVERDLRYDGVLQDATLGVKRRGEPDVEYTKPVLGGTITEW